jgi:hypothetical protein
MILTPQEIVDTFINIKLEGDYNLLQDDLVKLGNAIADKAAAKVTKEHAQVAREERAECVKFVRSLNHLVADALQGKRGAM